MATGTNWLSMRAVSSGLDRTGPAIFFTTASSRDFLEEQKNRFPRLFGSGEAFIEIPLPFDGAKFGGAGKSMHETRYKNKRKNEAFHVQTDGKTGKKIPGFLR